jgi:hypothetical protein
LNQINENDQKIIANITAPYVLNLPFNPLVFLLTYSFWLANLILIFVIFIAEQKKLD